MISDEPLDYAAEEENYFISMTDMMVGMIFIFIILLMYYALQMRDVTDQLTGADKTRTEILKKLQSSLKSKGVTVTIDPNSGVLRLPDAILFDSARADIKPDGVKAVEHLAMALAETLPCYADRTDSAWRRPATCPKTQHRIESLYIEGHTDSVPLAPSPQFHDNWDLSVKRATSTFRALIAKSPDLPELCAKKYDKDTKMGWCDPVLSVSGYADQRPVPGTTGTKEDRNKGNRRIELRILMATPDSGETKRAVQAGLQTQ